MNGTTTAGFLSFNRKPPQLHVCGEDDEFDPATLRFFRDEGFDVTYHSVSPAFASEIAAVPDSLQLGEYYAIVAFGTAATVCLQLAQKPMPRLCAMVVYYPDVLPSPNFKYPTQLPLILHLSGAQSLSGTTMKTYWYRGTEAGFAEMDLAEYEPIAAGLAWSRTLGAVRKGFKINVDLESVWEEHIQCKRPLLSLHLDQLLGGMVLRGTRAPLKQLGHAHSVPIAFVVFFISVGGWADEFSLARLQTSSRKRTRRRP